MQPRFAALLFVLGLADLAYVNLGLGHEVFGDGASAPSTGGGLEPRAREAARAPSAPPAPAKAAPSIEQEPSAAVPSPPAPSTPPPGTPAPAVTPSTPPAPAPQGPALEAPTSEAPTSEPTALPAPSPQVEPPGELAPSVEPAPRPETPGAPAPSADTVAGSPRPAQAGVEAAPAPRADVASARPSSAPDAELTVPFPDTASAWLGEEAQAHLLQLAAQLRAHPDYRIHIVGHADARGSREFNLDLGSRRARAVTELLARAGVSREQLEMESRGEDQPKVYGNSEQTWAANRRVEISIGVERSTAP